MLFFGKKIGCLILGTTSSHGQRQYFIFTFDHLDFKGCLEFISDKLVAEDGDLLREERRFVIDC
jgi:hypothetical protein